MVTYKPKYQVLQEFTKILYKENPMAFNFEGNPYAEYEYESEALSILSRFNEGAINLCEDESLQRELAVSIVNQAFQFWFSEHDLKVPESLAFELLAAYVASYS
jgi:hypothetical protein